MHSFKCVFSANYILLHLLLMDFHPAESVVTGTQALHARKQCFVFTFDFDQLRNLCSENLVLLCLLGCISSLLTAFLSALGLSSCSQFLLFLMPWSMLPCGRVHFLPLPTQGERATTNTPFGGLFFIPTSLTYLVSKH